MQAILDRARGPFRRRPGGSTPPYAPEQIPDPRDVDIWWDDLIVPELDPLPAPARAAIEDRLIASLGAVPASVARAVRGALYAREPETVVAGARRLVRLAADAPADAGDAPPPFSAREREAAQAVSGAAELAPEPESAMRLALLRLGGDADAAEGLAPILMASAQVPGDGGLDPSDEDMTDEDLDDLEEGADVLFRRLRENLRPREGGFADNPNDPGGPTQKGVSQRLWEKIRDQERYKDFPRETKDLTEGQVEQIFRTEFFDQPKVDRLARVPGLMDVRPEFVEQYFDTAVLHGGKSAGTIVQEALDDVMGTDLREPDPKRPGTKAYDGNVGPRTRNAIAKAVEGGKIDQVNDRMVDLRLDFMRQQLRKDKNLETFRNGWLTRAEEFRVNN